MMTVNFIPARVLDQRRAHKRAVRWAGALGVYAAALLIAMVVLHAPEDQEESRLRDQAARAEAAESEARTQHLAIMRDLALKQRLLRASQTVGVHPDWGMLLRTVTDLRGDKVALTGIELRREARKAPAPKPRTDKDKGPGKDAGKGDSADLDALSADDEAYAITLSGLGVTPTDVLSFVRRLEEQSPLREVVVVDTRSQKVGAGELTSFELRCRLSARQEDTP